MKIGQFTDTFLPVVDGVGRVAYNYCSELALKGHEAYACVPMCDTGYRGNYPFEIVDYVSIPVPGLSHYRVGTPALDRHFSERIKLIDFDIIHCHSPFIAGLEGKRLSKKLGIPLVGSFHSKYYDDFYKVTQLQAAAELGTDAVVHFFEGCDEVWAVSSSSAEVLRSYGFKGEITVMENGVEIVPPDQRLADRAEKQFGLDKEPVILFVGQMNWKKNILTLLESCAILRAQNVSFKLVLAGQGPDLPEIQSKVKELSLESVTVFAGHITDPDLLNGLYLRSAVFAFLSEYDNAPMVVREAAVMGTPSLLIEGSSAAEVVSDGFNGLLCQNNPQSAAQRLMSVLAYPDELGRLGTNALDTIPIPWSGIVDEALSRYQALIERFKKNT